MIIFIVVIEAEAHNIIEYNNPARPEWLEKRLKRLVKEQKKIQEELRKYEYEMERFLSIQDSFNIAENNIFTAKIYRRSNMKKSALVLSILLSLSMPISAFAMWEKDSFGWKYQKDDGTYAENEWYEANVGKWYYFGENGYMLTDTITPDGYLVNDEGECIYFICPDGHTGYDHRVDGTLTFLYGDETAQTPCRIYFNDYRNGTYTTVKYDAVYVQEWDGRFANIVIEYSVPKTGGYSSTFNVCDIYVNGELLTELGGPYGDLKIDFKQKYMTIAIPSETFKPGDLIEIVICG